ncbi:hypothetical protein ACWER6_09420 [Streptomyces sp. NPDC004009]
MTASAIAVLDTDGTLIDSDHHHARRDQVVTAVGGEEPERRVGDRAGEQQGREADELPEETAPSPGARDVLMADTERGHRLVPAGSAQQRHVEVCEGRRHRPL